MREGSLASWVIEESPGAALPSSTARFRIAFASVGGWMFVRSLTFSRKPFAIEG